MHTLLVRKIIAAQRREMHLPAYICAAVSAGARGLQGAHVRHRMRRSGAGSYNQPGCVNEVGRMPVFPPAHMD